MLKKLLIAAVLLPVSLTSFYCSAQDGPVLRLNEDEIQNLVRRSYQYVEMYNVNNKFALDPANPTSLGGWNRIRSQDQLLDHTMKSIARPNNDTFYTTAMLDLTTEPIIIEAPAVDSAYVSLMVTGYDHYVNVPMSTRLGDFSKPSRILFYSARTPNYSGGTVEGIDHIFKATGDFISAVYRVMPHASDPDRMKRVVGATKEIKVVPLSEYLGKPAPKAAHVEQMPPFGQDDFDVFANNLLEVMQFVFNHTTFDPNDDIDRGVLAAYEPLGVAPGRVYEAAKAARIDGEEVRRLAENIATAERLKATDPAFRSEFGLTLFKPKGYMTLERLLFQSVIGPIGLPAEEAVYPAISSADGAPMNAQHDYEIRMTAAEMPPAKAFWSVTLYDIANGFFIPNDRKKYSVGENGGMQLDSDGGITIRISADPPTDVPEENWLPINRGDYDIGPTMRIYAPDLEKFSTWEVPKAVRIN